MLKKEEKRAYRQQNRGKTQANSSRGHAGIESITARRVNLVISLININLV